MAQAEFFMLVCKDGKSNKFWTYDISQNMCGEYVLQITYGRIGTKGQTTSKIFLSGWEAQHFANNKIHEKTGKGYHRTGEDEYRFLCLLAAIVGTGNKVEEAAIVVAQFDAFSAYEVKPQVLADPTIEPSFIVGIRLRDKKGATDPYYLCINNKYTLLLKGVERTEYLRTAWGPIEPVKHFDVTAHWSWVEHRAIDSSHELAPLVERAEQVIGHALLS